MAGEKRSGAYGEDDFVAVVNDSGVVQADLVPKAWVGTDLLPHGWKAATKAQIEGKDGGVPAEPPKDEVPAIATARPELEAYAAAHGFTEEEAKAFPNKEELHAALVAKAAEQA